MGSWIKRRLGGRVAGGFQIKDALRGGVRAERESCFGLSCLDGGMEGFRGENREEEGNDSFEGLEDGAPKEPTGSRV